VAELRPLLFLVALFAFGCAAQSSSPSPLELNRRVGSLLRSQYQLSPNVVITVGQRRPSEFPNYDLISVTLSTGARQSTQDFLLSRDGKTLASLRKFDISDDVMSKIEVKGRPFRGNKDAKVVVVNFDDFQCPFCSRLHQTLFPGILKDYGDRIKIIYKDFPLSSIHPWADHAAVDANCLAAQNNDAYWDFADYVHINQPEITGEKRPLSAQFAALDRLALETGQRRGLDAPRLEACVKAQSDAAVRASVKEGSDLGVDGTPALFVNGERASGAIPDNELRMVLDRALRDANQPVPARAAAKPSASPATGTK